MAQTSEKKIIVNLPSRTLEYYCGDFVKQYPVAIGSPLTPTPLGQFKITSLDVNPWWYPPNGGQAVPSGPHNPLGYRWIEFLPAYGIHGTNAPWSIGLAVSNGCIRMREPDVEELFEMVSLGTSVSITYERIRICIDRRGKATLSIYPDLYNYRSITPDDVVKKLEESGCGGLLTERDIQNLMKTGTEHQIILAYFHQLMLNGKQLGPKGFSTGEVKYVPVKEVANEMRTAITWDAKNQLVRWGSRFASGKIRGGVLYVASENIPVLFGGQQQYRPDTNTIEMEILTWFLNGIPMNGEPPHMGKVPSVPVLPLAQALGQKISWDAETLTLTIRGRRVPVEMVNGQPYIPITHIFEYFQAYVYWNEAARSVELTYPQGGND
ncbi:L,D-transpeptidase family protein [Acetonema longum]|nr:L,D-transpeptidase family protein [Acetonema longum]